VKIAAKILGVAVALAVLAGVMAYLAGFFEEKISIDAVKGAPEAGNGETVTVEVTQEPLIEQAAGTLRAKVETVISPLLTATISSIAVWAGDEVNSGEVLVTLDSRIQSRTRTRSSGPGNRPGGACALKTTRRRGADVAELQQTDIPH
jgi:multidrug efflux pump subunit AcrA (membrane-fusion protein)